MSAIKCVFYYINGEGKTEGEDIIICTLSEQMLKIKG